MGNEQVKELVEMDISSPTVSCTSVYAVAAIAAIDGRKVMTLDMGGAFLNADIPSSETSLVKLDKVNSGLLCQLQPEYKKLLSRDEVYEKKNSL